MTGYLGLAVGSTPGCILIVHTYIKSKSHKLTVPTSLVRSTPCPCNLPPSPPTAGLRVSAPPSPPPPLQVPAYLLRP